jgi:bile acid:Na+ symporter, BASS family
MDTSLWQDGVYKDKRFSMLVRCISKLSFVFQSYFGLLVLLVGILACTLPISLHAFLPVVPFLLGLIMLGIGLTLRSQDFSELFKNPRLILLRCVNI